jgi:uncharacterized cupin superfamily protein
LPYPRDKFPIATILEGVCLVLDDDGEVFVIDHGQDAFKMPPKLSKAARCIL